MEDTKYVIYNETQNAYWTGGRGYWNNNFKSCRFYSNLSSAKNIVNRYVFGDFHTNENDEIFILEVRVTKTITDNKIKV